MSIVVGSSMFRSIKVIIWFSALLFYFKTNVVFGETFVLLHDDNVVKKIESGKSGDVFILQPGRYDLLGTIHMPSGVTIQGHPGKTTIYKNFYMDELPFFDVKNTIDVTIKDIIIELDSRAYGILAQNSKDTITKNLKINHVSILGNLASHPVNQMDESRIAIYLSNVDHVEISKTNISNTIGGIYVLKGNQITIMDNELKGVNSGNIVVKGSDIKIVSNTTQESGIGTNYEFSEGDAITILEDSSNIEISDNVLENGHCYMIWVHPKVNHIMITGNRIDTSITSGVYLDHTDYVVVSNNNFIMNSFSGVAVDSAANIWITNNFFYSNTVRFFNVKTNFTVKNNMFSGMSHSSLTVPGDQDLDLDNNNIVNYYPDDSDPPTLLLVTRDGQLIRSGDSVEFDRHLISSITFEMINEGQQSIKFIGAPLVTLSGDLAFEESCRINPLGSSTFGGLHIDSMHQPRRRALFPGGTTKFRIELCSGCKILGSNKSEVIANIMTDSDKYKPFWFKIKLI